MRSLSALVYNVFVSVEEGAVSYLFIHTFSEWQRSNKNTKNTNLQYPEKYFLHIMCFMYYCVEKCGYVDTMHILKNSIWYIYISWSGWYQAEKNKQ